MLWSGGLFTSATRGTMPVGAYILTGSPMSDKSKGRDKTKTDLLAPGFVRSLLVRKQQRKEPKHLDAISFQRKLPMQNRQEWRTFIAALYASRYCKQ